ncbi:3-phenylpropionate/cinnamic acid dioxygenase subunit beta [Amycolatopsis rhabdoformis]|uniref:3-phenylpropionate/cinnamic acid dioxygenase subunit beta n=1 Tax=Amycolatopsis rhabdoformis TaxID=1448059 RepID=A0ABZ1IGL3_9PSEU|nr:3-phenylpropionate/cinnamic acid dioxygenase subunit beta [Amycolatopsis rhabdoformis]WSE33554.1 3-phenylpropionate/cinnamic acid dioxygenase subunit beta [Amycolatopsis rhabdoformis]
MSSTAGTGVDLATRIEIHDFYAYEAELLDDRRWEDWVDLFAPEVEYTAPIRVHRKSPAPDIIDELGHFDDTKSSLTLRAKRLRTDVAWAEDPPSHTRRLITNIRVRAGETDTNLVVRTNFLLYRSRGDLGAFDLIVGERQDVLRREGQAWLIAKRRIIIDQSSMSTKNLGVFL